MKRSLFKFAFVLSVLNVFSVVFGMELVLEAPLEIIKVCKAAIEVDKCYRGCVLSEDSLLKTLDFISGDSSQSAYWLKKDADDCKLEDSFWKVRKEQEKPIVVKIGRPDGTSFYASVKRYQLNGKKQWPASSFSSTSSSSSSSSSDFDQDTEKIGSDFEVQRIRFQLTCPKGDCPNVEIFYEELTESLLLKIRNDYINIGDRDHYTEYLLFNDELKGFIDAAQSAYEDVNKESYGHPHVYFSLPCGRSFDIALPEGGEVYSFIANFKDKEASEQSAERLNNSKKPYSVFVTGATLVVIVGGCLYAAYKNNIIPVGLLRLFEDLLSRRFSA